MMTVAHTRLLGVLLLSIVCIQATAQLNRSTYELGFKAGTFLYQGDLTPSDAGSYKTLQPQFGIFASRFLSNSFAVRLNLDLGSLRGDDSKFADPAWRRQRNFKFHTPIVEVSGQLVWDILGRNYNRPAKSLSPYIFAGIGYAYRNVHRDWSSMDSIAFPPESLVAAGLVADAAPAARHGTLVIPAGIGLRYALSQKVSVIGETSYRFTTTDYLDGFSYSANPGKNDHYYSHSIGIVYSFGKKDSWDCPAKP